MLICHILLIPILINFVTVKFEGIGSRDGYEFTGWSDGTSTYTSSGTSTFAMGSSNVTLTAIWSRIYIGTKAPTETKIVGDIMFSDGSDNFAKIKEALGNEDDTSNLSNYPAFEFAINYKDKDGSYVKGSVYENGWYFPTVAELYDIHKEIETVDAALEKCGGNTFAGQAPEDDGSTYWSSSQQPLHCESSNSNDGDRRAYGLDVVTSAYYDSCYKINNWFYVCCIRKF